MTDQELPRIAVERALPRWISGVQPQYRLTVSGRGRSDHQVCYLYNRRDIEPFLAGVFVGYTERSPDRLRKRSEAPPEESIFYEGVKVGLKAAGVALPFSNSSRPVGTYILACEDVGD